MGHGQSPSGASELERAWVRIRASLRESAGARLFDQWLKPVRLVLGEDADIVRLALPSPFMADWVRSHYADRLLLEFRQALPGMRGLLIETRAPGDLTEVVAAEPVATAAASLRSPAPRPALDDRLCFDRFVTGASNRVAVNAARLLAQPGAPRFSPLFVHAPTGLGKTHLLHAIGHAFLAEQPEATVLFMSAERFMFDFVQAVRARDTFTFKSRLRAADLLMIDDLQFIAGKDSTQEEFFHTINEIIGAGKRLAISADRCPQALDGVDARIVSRLGIGLVADIRPPDLALRKQILERKLADVEAVVPAGVLELLASRITGSIRELEGALNRVVAYAQLTGDALDLDFALATLGEQLRGSQRRVTIDEIQTLVSRHFDLKPLDMISARRARAVARPRQIAMYLAKRLTTRSLPEIGRKFGGRDHSTVIHAVRRVEQLRDCDREVDAAVRVLLRELEG